MLLFIFHEIAMRKSTALQVLVWKSFQWKGLPGASRSLSLGKAVLLGKGMERLYAALGKRDEPPITHFSALQLGCHHTYSIEKARRLLGYEPTVNPYHPFEQQFQMIDDWACFEPLFC